ncbi:hypothetical protein K8F61_08765 [Microbacterium resistens]|uniref:SHOCT domain-containing protein n=1 Tax=Microbacterium resistens TaxID=156977 RepID=A0ABY3RYV6_9MICO|nr:hypothetical protein K8F61_08765 [Microbacterium resistens]
MRKWVVRIASLYVFTVVVLLVIGWLMPTVSVGWHALWAGVVLTAAALAVKPLLTRVFRNAAARSSRTRSRAGEKAVQYALVFAVELVVWILTVWFSGVHVRGWFWGYVLPPLILLIAWVVYDAIDDRVEAKAGELYDAAGARLGRGGMSGPQANAPAQAPPSAADHAARTQGRAELDDGLTPEQRRMLDELG